MLPDDRRHGTYAGANAHWKEGEAACGPCQRAATRYAKQRGLADSAPRTVSSLGTIRRIRALQRIGWPLSAIADRIGWRPESRTALVPAGDKVTVDLHNRVAAVYEELSMTLGPSIRSRNYGIRNGWLPPLAWDSIDDPNERPADPKPETAREEVVDEAVVLRVMAGERRPRKLTNAEARMAVKGLLARGVNLRCIEKDYGLKPSRYMDGAA